MADDRCRELERKWRATGAMDDEAKWAVCLARSGKLDLGGYDVDRLGPVLLRRLVEAGVKGEGFNQLLALLPQVAALVHEAEPAPTGDFADEEAESNLVYPEEFSRLTVAQKRTAKLATWVERFPSFDLTGASQISSGPLPAGAEDWAIIPKPSRLGGYHQALEVMLGLITGQRDFQNWREGQLGPEHLRLTERTQTWLNRLESEQPGDFLAFPFQFGLRHRGRSIRRARFCFAANEVGLGPYEVAALLVTHPDRITGSDQLHGIDCAGCEYRDEASGAFPYSLSFSWCDDRLEFGSYGVGTASEEFGSASGFAS